MRRLLVLCACLFISNGHLMAADDDLGIWTFAGLNVKASKVISLYTEAELRTRDNSGTVDCWSLYGEISARICPYLKAGGGYTYIDYNHPSLSWESRHRLNVFVTGNYSVGRWSFAIRERYEQVHRVLTDKSAHTPAPKRTLRSRAECNYKIAGSRFAPYATVELYTLLNAKGRAANEKIRYTAGTAVELSKHTVLSVYYRYVDMLQHAPGSSNIFGIGVRFNI